MTLRGDEVVGTNAQRRVSFFQRIFGGIEHPMLIGEPAQATAVFFFGGVGTSIRQAGQR